MLRFVLALITVGISRTLAEIHQNSKSGLRAWVDIDTPKDAYTTTSSRGDTWALVMSDEFNRVDRNFSYGKDHMWTALDMPDGVNGALEYYSSNMTSVNQDDDGTSYFQIKIMEDLLNFTVYNQYKDPAPGYEEFTMHYRGGMVQSWNKFCYQGGKVEVRAQLPGAMSPTGGNPDVGKSKYDPAGVGESKKFYPTWPGIWLMGNLGRAIFSGSTNRMWPWSFDECDPTLEKDQRISACNKNPGHGLNPYQGRGSPEIDILEGGGDYISSSIQIAPGMPLKYRLLPSEGKDERLCSYWQGCETEGANLPNVPTSVYKKRGNYTSWYSGLKYGRNTFCTPDQSLIQNRAQIMKSLADGITENTCSLTTCPHSSDVMSDLSAIDGSTTRFWGINEDGTCFSSLNVYQGIFLCDPLSTNPRCGKPSTQFPAGLVSPFDYQMDALSANYAPHIEAYTGYLNYQIEWVMGNSGYLRWSLNDVVVYEIPAETLRDVPDDGSGDNPKKLMIEEPMYFIFNIAVSEQWGAVPSNGGKACRGDGLDPVTNKICDQYPMYMKIDHIRIWQDVSEGSNMAVGCDPASHPTKQFIEDNIEDYTNENNKYVPVHGGATCETDDDCSLELTAGTFIKTGKCNKQKRCYCYHPDDYSGPRCTTSHIILKSGTTTSFGPSFELAIGLSVGVGLIGLLAALYHRRSHQKYVANESQASSNVYGAFAKPVESQGAMV